MALSNAEKTELEALRKRAAEADELETQNAELSTEVGEAAAALAQTEIDKQEAVKLAVAEREAELMEEMTLVKSGQNSKHVIGDPKKPPKFDPKAYYGQCSGGDERYAQSGWYFGSDREPIRPIRKAKKKKAA